MRRDLGIGVRWVVFRMYIVHECVPVSSHSNEAQVWEYVASRSRARVCVRVYMCDC